MLTNPNQVNRRRKIAETLMMQGSDTSPVQHPFQALARVAQGGIGGYGQYQADQQEAEGMAGANAEMARLLQGNPDNAAIMQAMNNPWASEGSSRLAELLLKNNVDPGKDAKRGLNPVWMLNEKTGRYELGQLNEGGGALEIVPTPDGYEILPQTTVQDFGTNKRAVSSKGGRFVGEPMPIDIEGRELAEQSGAAAGKAAGAAPAAAITAQQTVQKIDELLADPELGSISGWQSYLPDGGVALTQGSHALGLRRRVEQLKGTAFLEAYNGLRGGGQITEVEGRKAEEAIARLETAQSDADYVQALRDFRDAVVVGYQKLAASAHGRAPQLTIPPAQTGAPDSPPGVDPELWQHMTPEERALWQ